MNDHPASEITSYLQHQDYTLAIRRLLDICLDTGKPDLIRKAINISSSFHKEIKNNNAAKAAGDLNTSATEVLKQIQLEIPKATNIELLVSADDVSTA